MYKKKLSDVRKKSLTNYSNNKILSYLVLVIPLYVYSEQHPTENVKHKDRTLLCTILAHVSRNETRRVTRRHALYSCFIEEVSRRGGNTYLKLEFFWRLFMIISRLRKRKNERKRKKNDYAFPVFLRSPIIICMCVLTEIIESGRIQTDSLQAPALVFQETGP